MSVLQLVAIAISPAAARSATTDGDTSDVLGEDEKVTSKMDPFDLEKALVQNTVPETAPPECTKEEERDP